MSSGQLAAVCGGVSAKALLLQQQRHGTANGGVSSRSPGGVWRGRASHNLTVRAVSSVPGGRAPAPDKKSESEKKKTPADAADAKTKNIAAADPAEAETATKAAVAKKKKTEGAAKTLRSQRAAGVRETFFQEEYDITLREFAPTAVKVSVESNGVKFRVKVETDAEAELILHWGVAEMTAPDKWIMPPAYMMPRDTKALAEVCQTPLVKGSRNMASTVIEGDLDDAPHTINFVLHDQKYNQWYHSLSGDFFRIPLMSEPEPEPEPEPVVAPAAAAAAAAASASVAVPEVEEVAIPEVEEVVAEVEEVVAEVEEKVAKVEANDDDGYDDSVVQAAIDNAMADLGVDSLKEEDAEEEEETTAVEKKAVTKAAASPKKASGGGGIGSLLGTLSSYKGAKGKRVRVKKEELVVEEEEEEKEAPVEVAAAGKEEKKFKKGDKKEAEAEEEEEEPAAPAAAAKAKPAVAAKTAASSAPAAKIPEIKKEAPSLNKDGKKRVNKANVAALLQRKAVMARTKAVPMKAKAIAVKAVAANKLVNKKTALANSNSAFGITAPSSANPAPAKQQQQQQQTGFASGGMPTTRQPVNAAAAAAANPSWPAVSQPRAAAAAAPPRKEGPWETTFEFAETVFTEVEVVSKVGVKVETSSDQPGAPARIRVETDLPGDLLLHWGVVPRGARADMWTIPAPSMRPEGSKVFGDRAVQTPMQVVKGGMVGDFRYTELDMGSAPGGVRFVIKEQGGRDRWFDNYGGDFVVPLPEQALSSSLHVRAPQAGVTSPGGAPTPAAGPPGSKAAQDQQMGMEAAQMALGGAASAAFGGAASAELVDASIEEAIHEAAIAMETARHAREIAEQATAAAQDLPENEVANTKARRLIAQANAAAERAATAAKSAEAAAIRARAAKDASFDDLSAAAAAAAAAQTRAEEVEKMAQETWAGEISEISEDTLQRWRDEMELAVTKEAEQKAAKAEAAALEMLEQRKAAQKQQRVEAEQRAAAEAAEAQARAAVAAEAEARARVAAAEEAAARAAAQAAMTETEKEEEQERMKLEDIERELKEKAAALAAMQTPTLPTPQQAPSPPAWLTVDAPPAVIPGKSDNTADASAWETALPPNPANIVPLVQTEADAGPPLPPGQKIMAPTGNGREMLIQGFNWESCRMKPTPGWYNKIKEMAPKLAEYGITTIWLPPPTNSVSEEGYMPQDLYDLNSKYGTKEELRDCINALHVHGIKALGDAVLNHRCAGLQGPDGLWNQYTGKLNWDARAIVSDDPHFGGQGNRSSGDFFHAAPNIDHSQDFVKRDICEWLQWMQAEVGYDGWRLDYVRGFSGTHVKTYMESTDVKFAVGEFWDTLSYDYDQPQYNQDDHRQRIVNWIDDAGGSAGAFDVTTKGILHAVFERQEYWRLSDCDGAPPGVLGRWPSRAVTFIENHDTGSTQGHWRFPEGFELQGYAYILTHPGTPTIFWDHLFEWDNGSMEQPIRDLMKFREEQGIHCRSVVKILKAEQSVYAAQIDDSVIMKIGPGQFAPDEGQWEYAMHGNDYCIWRARR